MNAVANSTLLFDKMLFPFLHCRGHLSLLKSKMLRIAVFLKCYPYKAVLKNLYTVNRNFRLLNCLKSSQVQNFCYNFSSFYRKTITYPRDTIE